MTPYNLILDDIRNTPYNRGLNSLLGCLYTGIDSLLGSLIGYLFILGFIGLGYLTVFITLAGYFTGPLFSTWVGVGWFALVSALLMWGSSYLGCCWSQGLLTEARLPSFLPYPQSTFCLAATPQSILLLSGYAAIYPSRARALSISFTSAELYLRSR